VTNAVSGVWFQPKTRAGSLGRQFAATQLNGTGTAIRGTKRYERFAGIAGSIRFNARELHHFGRLFGFVGEELTEVGR